MPTERRVTLRLSKNITDKFDSLAKETGLNYSVLMRNALMKANPKLPSKEGLKNQLQIIRLMSKSSNNINQIAHHLNSLNLQGKLEYNEFIHYLRILDTIEAQQHLLLSTITQ
ncbi:MAG: plasmid mobilization relaxosome protein MobC [Pasteurella sp.]|nr:plasmid mobilization relaxosome protein MobC [Pasteurella sp.]